MDTQVKENKLSKLSGQKNVFLFFSVILSLVVILQAILLFTKKERIVIVPTSGPSYWIEEGRVSSAYLEKMGIFLSDLLLNRSAADVEKRNQILLQYVHPSSYPEFKRQLTEEANAIVKNGQAFFFRMLSSSVDLPRSSFIIKGESDVWVEKEAGSFAIQKQERQYILRFRCENGKLMLDSLKKEAL